mgnify:CR=1 FL=1
MSQVGTLVSRVCPECLNRSFFEDPESRELCCSLCGLVLRDGLLPDRGNDGYEQETHSATNSLHFDGALGTDMDQRTMYLLMAKNQVGSYGCEGLGFRYGELRKILGKTKKSSDLHTAQEYASRLLEKCGLKHTPSSPNQESRFSHIIGNDLGRVIRRFYRKMMADLAQLGYLPLVTIHHQEIVQNLLAALLAREAILNNDLRRYYRVAPQLQRLNADVMGILGRQLYPSMGKKVNASSPSRRSSSNAPKAQCPS